MSNKRTSFTFLPAIVDEANAEAVNLTSGVKSYA